MSFLDKLEEYTLSPVKVSVNLLSDVMTEKDCPSWGEIHEAFKKPQTGDLPDLKLTQNRGSVTISGARTTDAWPPHTKPSSSFSLSQSAG